MKKVSKKAKKERVLTKDIQNLDMRAQELRNVMFKKNQIEHRSKNNSVMGVREN